MDDKKLKDFEELFFRLHGRLVLFSLKFTGDMQAAKDIVQDTFLSLWEKADEINVSPKAYLFQAVKNTSLNYIRHTKISNNAKEQILAQINLIEQNVYTDFNNPYFSLLELELEEKIEKVINTLPPKSLEVFNLRREEHLKNKEIAERLGVSVKAVEKHISKVFAILRRELSEYMMIAILIFLHS
jgi:RNA polymerase sigma-70 factor (ECF subfamily)